MNDIDVLKTACKIFGLYFLIQTIISIRDFALYSTMVSLNDNEGLLPAVGVYTYQAIFNVTIGLILVFKADAITQKLNPARTGELKLNFDKTDWIELTIIAISILAMLTAFPEILHKLTYYLYFNDYERNERELFWTGKNKADMFYSVFKFAIALLCLLNARNLALRLKKVGDRDETLMEKKD